MIASVILFLSYGLLNTTLSPSKFVYTNENLHCCNGCLHGITCSLQKSYVTCGHNISSGMSFSIKYDEFGLYTCVSIRLCNGISKHLHLFRLFPLRLLYYHLNRNSKESLHTIKDTQL